MSVLSQARVADERGRAGGCGVNALVQADVK
jgi:hypothetical protein